MARGVGVCVTDGCVFDRAFPSLLSIAPPHRHHRLTVCSTQTCMCVWGWGLAWPAAELSVPFERPDVDQPSLPAASRTPHRRRTADSGGAEGGCRCVQGRDHLGAGRPGRRDSCCPHLHAPGLRNGACLPVLAVLCMGCLHRCCGNVPVCICVRTTLLPHPEPTHTYTRYSWLRASRCPTCTRAR